MRPRSTALATTLVLAAVMAPTPAGAEAPGDVDRSFTYAPPAGAPPSTDEFVPAVAVQSDQRVVHVVRSGATAQVRRTLSGGAPDATWGAGGAVAAAAASVLRVLPDDRVLVAGSDDLAHAYALRLTRDGRPDPAFADGGMSALPLEAGYTAAEATAVLPLPGGGLVVAGQARFGGGPDTDPFVYVLRADGTLEPGFRPGDAVMFPDADGTGADTDTVAGVVADLAGGYWAVGTSGTVATGFHLEAWHFDPSAGTTVSTRLGSATATAAAPGPQAGALFVVGTDTGGGFAARLVGSPTAITLDPAWGAGGRAAQPLSPLAVTALPDGRLVVLGHDGAGRDVLSRVTAAGVRDTGFGGGTTVLPGASAAAALGRMAVASAPDGRLLVGSPAAGSPSRGRLVRVVGDLARTSVRVTAGRVPGPTQGATVTFRNDGPDASGTGVVDVAVTGPFTGTLSTDRGVCAGAAPRWTCDVGSLGPGQVVTLSATLRSSGAATGVLTATGRGTAYDDGTADQTATATITSSAASFSMARPPRVVGTPRVGSRLRAAAGTWSPTPESVRYRWLRNGRAIARATRVAYRVVPKDRGRRISVRVTVRRPGFTSASAVARAVRIRR